MLKARNFILSVIALIMTLTTANILCARQIDIYGISNITPPEIKSEAAILIDAVTGQILYAKNEHKKLYPASITKVMTSLLALEKGNLDDVFTADSTTINFESSGTNSGIEVGERLTIKQLLYFTLLVSGNDAANGLGQYVSKGDLKAFYKLMNERAAELGCLNSNFCNTNGLNNSKHVTTAYDMSLIMKRAVEIPEFRKIISTSYYKAGVTNKVNYNREYTNSNKLIIKDSPEYYKYCVGGKTGWTTPSGNTLITYAEKDGRKLICVILKANGYKNAYMDTRNLYDYGFDKNNFIVTKLNDEMAPQKKIKITEGGKAIGEVTVTVNKNDALYIPKNIGLDNIEIKLICPVSVNKGEQIDVYAEAEFTGTNLPKGFSTEKIRLSAVVNEMEYYPEPTPTETASSAESPEPNESNTPSGTDASEGKSDKNNNNIWPIVLLTLFFVIIGVVIVLRVRKLHRNKKIKYKWRRIYDKNKRT